VFFVLNACGEGIVLDTGNTSPQEWTDILGAISLFLCNTTMPTFISLLVIFSWLVCVYKYHSEYLIIHPFWTGVAVVFLFVALFFFICCLKRRVPPKSLKPLHHVSSLSA